jgi:rhodanese-related sulfurtransferase
MFHLGCTFHFGRMFHLSGPAACPLLVAASLFIAACAPMSTIPQTQTGSSTAQHATTTPGSLVPIDAAQLAPEKRTVLGLYLSAQQAQEKLLAQRQSAGRSRIAFFDLRTQAELMYTGVPDGIDANIPLMLADFEAFDEKAGRFVLHKNGDFSKAFAQRLAQLGLDKQSEVILICRSGDRTARAVNELTRAGYTRLYTVVDGFEGDTAEAGPDQGKRVVNGWKNAGLPWSFKLDKAKMALPAP